jgi:hypothetical protein
MKTRILGLLLAFAFAGYASAQYPGATAESPSQNADNSSPSTTAADSGNQSNPNEQTLAGMISNVDPSANKVTLRLNDQYGRVMTVDAGTTILRDGKPAQITDLHTGESATVVASGNTALRIEAGQPGAE